MGHDQAHRDTPLQPDSGLTPISFDDAVPPSAPPPAQADSVTVMVQLEAQIARLQSELNQVQGRAGFDTSTPESNAAHIQLELARRDEALALIADRLRTEQSRVSELESQLLATREDLVRACANGTTAGAVSIEQPEAEARITLRRRRLDRYKSLLHAQSRKLLAAKTALQKRHQECEAVLQQRGKLAQAAAELASQRKLVASKAARTSAAAMVFFLTATFAIVAAMAWVVGGQLAPATYATHAVIAADARDRNPTEDELNAWTAAHERLFEDPELMQLVADRFAQRDMPSLARPESVLARTKRDLSIMTDKAGQLTIELRGQGAEKTTRELETITLAVVAMANAKRDARGDGLPTTLREPPKAGTESISDSRLSYVVMVGFPSLLVAGALGFGIHRALARGKKSFENHMANVEATA